MVERCFAAFGLSFHRFSQAIERLRERFYFCGHVAKLLRLIGSGSHRPSRERPKVTQRGKSPRVKEKSFLASSLVYIFCCIW